MLPMASKSSAKSVNIFDRHPVKIAARGYIRCGGAPLNDRRRRRQDLNLQALSDGSFQGNSQREIARDMNHVPDPTPIRPKIYQSFQNLKGML